jgi:hypothetical protein
MHVYFNARSRLILASILIIITLLITYLAWPGEDLDARGTGLLPLTRTPSGEKCFEFSTSQNVPLFLNGTAFVSSKTLVLYNYFESVKAKRNLKFFLDHGVHERQDTDFLLVSNSHVCLDLPIQPNFGIIFRNNTCFDLGAYKETILRFDLGKRYSKFILLNGSVRGPFMPSWSKDCWTDAFTRRLNDTVKLVGPTFNCVDSDDNHFPHLQSMILATDRAGLEVLLSNYKCFTTKSQAIQEAEITNYPTMRKAGFDVHVFMDQFQVDRRDIAHCTHGVPRQVHPLEVIFIKTSPTILPEVVDAYTNYTDQIGYDSRKFC